MNSKFDIETYSKLGEGISFYLNESFHYINEALSSEFASLIFQEELQKIDPTEADQELIKEFKAPENPIEQLQAENLDALTVETIHKMKLAFANAQELANQQSHKFGHNHEINTISILGHLNNFGFFIETIVNRHLLFLHHSRQIDDFSYSKISSARVMERIIFIFKDELAINKIQINEISNLFKLRNKTVHYTPENAISLKPKLSELISIWNQTKKMLEAFEKKEKFKDVLFSSYLNENINIIRQKWT